MITYNLELHMKQSPLMNFSEMSTEWSRLKCICTIRMWQVKFKDTFKIFATEELEKTRQIL